jgi:hypothetical protein
MDVDVSPLNKSTIKSGIERMLELGRELLQMSLRLEKKYQNTNEDLIAQNRKMMEVSSIIHCSILRYGKIIPIGDLNMIL